MECVVLVVRPFSKENKILALTLSIILRNFFLPSLPCLPSRRSYSEEMDTPTFNRVRGVDMRKRNKDLYEHNNDNDEDIDEDYDHDNEDGNDEDDDEDDEDFGKSSNKKKKATVPSKKGKKEGGDSNFKSDEQMYYRITCRDNGCGMPHEKIPDFLGRVLAGSKYGVRQTRGKFGLGAKMALIWSKKSTGLPIQVKTAHSTQNRPTNFATSSSGGTDTASTNASSTSTTTPIIPQGISTATIRPPPKVSYCKLDIDIYKNLPHVLEHTLSDNTEQWIGTEITVTISGAWSSYRARVMHYFQQLAVITPYAQFDLRYVNASDNEKGKGGFSYTWNRRSTQIPRPPIEVKHHPSSVNDLLVRQLMDLAKTKNSSVSIASFLVNQFQCIDRPLAVRLITEIGSSITPEMSVDSLTPPLVHKLSRLLSVAKFDKPSGNCLSPAGEYNLRLGIMKELKPDLVATHSAPVEVFEGHPFIVETGVALGGQGPQGLTVHRFANRIPLLFEGGADVATKTAQAIPWGAYKIDSDKDKVGVFVSIVSTKIPFKGTGKEYIGNDIEILRDSVRKALMECCSQLRVKLLRAQAARARANRRKNLTKYIPDVVRALLAGMKSINARRDDLLLTNEDEDDDENVSDEDDEERTTGAKRSRSSALAPALDAVLNDYKKAKITETVLSSKLHTAVEKADMEAALEAATAATAGLGIGTSTLDSMDGGLSTNSNVGALNIYIGPTSIGLYTDVKEYHGTAAVFKLFPNALLHPSSSSSSTTNNTGRNK